MIAITDISGKTRYINPELIEFMELVPETLIVLTTGRRHLVREDPKTIIDRVIAYKKAICHEAPEIRRKEDDENSHESSQWDK